MTVCGEGERKLSSGWDNRGRRKNCLIFGTAAGSVSSPHGENTVHWFKRRVWIDVRFERIVASVVPKE
jgi:hypothetical protein